MTDEPATPSQSGADAPAGTRTAPDTVPSGPVSILKCASCGASNRIRPSAKGTPHCGSCGKALPWIVRADEATFDAEADASVAVVVDLWAEWCAPCRMLSPILEQIATEYAGRIKVVKVNVDENPGLARTFGAQSIPLLLVIQGGRIVDRIVGLQPRTELTVRLTPYLLRR